MRPLATIPAFLGIAALVLSFLCLFAGYRPGFMEDFDILTLNVSRFGSTFLNTTSKNTSNPFSALWDNIENSVQGDLNDAFADIAKDLGLRDWYSAHLLDFCYGNYTPGPVANLTIPESSIKKDTETCGNHTAMFFFDAHGFLQQQMNQSRVGRQLSQLGWPDELDQGLDAVRVAWKAAFVTYCIAIGLIGISTLASILGFCTNGRGSALILSMLAFLAFLAILLASAIMTAVGVKGSNAINKHGNPVGIEAHRGAKFLILTWVATGCTLFAWIFWMMQCITGRRTTKSYTYAKNG